MDMFAFALVYMYIPQTVRTLELPHPPHPLVSPLFIKPLQSVYHSPYRAPVEPFVGAGASSIKALCACAGGSEMAN